jgi:hypothetical protein
MHPPTQIGDLPPAPPPVQIPVGLSRSQFYQQDLLPFLDRSKIQYNANADKALERLHQDFDGFRSGIPSFVDDVTSWGTRFGIISRMTKDKWNNIWKNEDDPNSEAVKTYILDKFEAQIMSRNALQKSVQSSLGQFKDDTGATRNELLSEMKMALTTKDVRLDFPLPDFDTFQLAFDDYVASNVKSQGTASVENAVLTFIASTVATVATERLVVQILELVAGEAMAAGVEATVAGGSSTAGGAAIGGGAGSAGGPAGAAVGVGVGIVIGAIIDWWLTDRFKTSLTSELTGYLNNLEHDMIDGPKAKPEAGLRATLHTTADRLYLVQSKAVLEALTKAK